MRKASKRQPLDPDSYRQLPHPDLVCVPNPQLQLVEADLRYLDQLCKDSENLRLQLLIRARCLAFSLDDLQSKGDCPPALLLTYRRLMFVLGLSEVENPSPSTLCPCNIHTSLDLSENMDIASPPPVAPELCTKAEVVAFLSGIGFNDVDRVIAKFGLQHVTGVIEYTLSQPQGKVQNTGAYIRAVLSDSVPPGRRHQDPNRYISGRYGHLVKR